MTYNISIKNNKNGIVKNITIPFIFTLADYLHLPDLNGLTTQKIATKIRNTLEFLWDEENELIPLDSVSDKNNIGDSLTDIMKTGIFMAHLDQLLEEAIANQDTVWNIVS